jgi:xanthine/CO dehydrogenase XdhC/CoxF family maturation factor
MDTSSETQRTETQRIEVAQSKASWIVSAGGTTHAVFVGKCSRERAIEWALRLAESRRPHGSVVIVVTTPPIQPEGRLAS